MEEPVTFGAFFAASQELYKFILINPYELFVHPSPGPLRRLLASFFYWVTVASSALVVILQTLYLFDLTQRTDDIVPIIASAAWIPVSLMAVEANLFTWRFGPRCTRLVTVLETKFPKSREDQSFVSMRETFEKWNRLSWFVCRIFLFALYVIFFQNFALAVLGYAVYGTWVLKMPRLLWYPFDPWGSYWLQAAVYAWECWGTLTTTKVVVAIGLFLGSATTHICIQLDGLSRRFLELCPRGVNVAVDLEELISLVREHNYLMSVCYELGSIFKMSLVVNYVLSSIVIGCFGFLVLNEPVISQKTEYIFDFICFMCYNSLFSFYGDSLLDRVSGRSGSNEVFRVIL